MGLPSDIALMHPTQVARPFHREGWLYEEKYDGWRIVAHKVDGHVRLVGRNGLDHTPRFADLAAALAALPATTLILDGEVAVFDEQLVSRFEWLRHRAREAVATPPIYMAFDVLQAAIRLSYRRGTHLRYTSGGRLRFGLDAARGRWLAEWASWRYGVDDPTRALGTHGATSQVA